MSAKRPFSPSSTSPAKKFAPWCNALEDALKNPSLILFQDDRVAIIADKFPKARFHFLALPFEKINSLQQLNSSHVALLEHMIERSRDFAKTNIEPKTKNGVRIGFHMVPSMSRLHLHLVSGDLISPCLKNKKHWNSFASSFFMPAESVLKCLKEKGQVDVNTELGEELLKNPLRCHICSIMFSKMPNLKTHLAVHDQDRTGKDGA